MILELGNNNYQDFVKFNSLRNTLTNSRSNMSLSSCLLVTLIKQHLDMYTYSSEHCTDDGDLQLFISPFITARKVAGIYWVIFSCFNSVYSPILFSCRYYGYLNETSEFDNVMV